MLVELGPVGADEAQAWTRFARRMLCELRTNPSELASVASEDWLRQWSSMIDTWATAATTAGDGTFRWSEAIDCEQAEYMLHGVQQCIASSEFQAKITEAESEAHTPFTLHVLKAFADGLITEGRAHEHYVDQMRDSLATLDAR
ncbi:MAG: hypothetical protein AAF467_11235 [Actinomycetota bacterium]